MLLDKIAMITMLILYILVGIMTLFTYLVTRSESQNKTEWEREIDDEEQMNYLKKYKKNLKTDRS